MLKGYLMTKKHKYISKIPDEFGNCHYTEEEHAIWKVLIDRQMGIVKNRACPEFIKGLEILGFTHEKIPKYSEVNERLMKATGWKVEPVPAVIGPTEFYTLLANKKFPMATFIRRMEDLDYLQEPDIFHELFGHCPLITNQMYADFLQHYGETALKASEKDRLRLFRLFWFTIEFGLIRTDNGLRVYGGGILSSKEETVHCLEGIEQVYKKMDALECLRTPFRIDIIQPIYFVIDSFKDLFGLKELKLVDFVNQSRELKSYPALFERKIRETEDEIQGKHLS
jgi:phenylalanine-4-hydroxylase